MTNDALVFVGRITAQGTSTPTYQSPIYQSPQWFQAIQATAAIATTLGVLIALYVDAIREPRKAAAEHRHHTAQLNALRRAVMARVAAQARKVVPSCVRTPMFGDSWWTVRIDNASNAATTILAVDVKAIDANGIEVPDGCTQANNTMSVDQAFDRSILTALTGSLQQRSNRLPPAFKQILRDALAAHFVKEWLLTLSPNQHAMMAYTTTDPNYLLRITIGYEDEAGSQWRRTDTSQPRRTDTDSLMARRAMA